jgi:serine protease Do
VQKKIVNQLKEFGRTKRGWLGVQITPVSQEIAESLGLDNQKGAFISNINPEGPSKEAGIQEGDVILEFNNIEIIKMTDLPRVVAESDVGTEASVLIWRKNKLIEIQVTLGELPEKTYVERKDVKNIIENEYYIDILNLTIGTHSKDEGVIVLKIDIVSNLKVGDIISEVNREIIYNAKNFIELIESIKITGRKSLLLKIIRDEKSVWVTIPFVK